MGKDLKKKQDEKQVFRKKELQKYFIEQEKTKIRNRYTRRILDDYSNGNLTVKNNVLTVKEFRKTPEFRAILDTRVHEDKQWKLLSSKTPFDDPAIASRFKKKRKNIINILSAKKADREKREKQKSIFSEIKNIEDIAYTDLYPKARAMKRHFRIHAGPTNSGKTYDAIQALMEASTGVYLGPLRLLAFEQYEKLNKNGVICNLITGEEKILMPGAMHSSCTIETADYDNEYHTVVIDEAQMITDRARGGAWTEAILGIRAWNIELCCAPQAVGIITRMIKDCGDTYEIIHHNRMTSLEVEKTPFAFPKDVQDGDALIVFSKKSVYAVASAIRESGKKCSVVYGSLPYNVRRKEAERFAGNETQAVVATDAIGMGINLPIKRVVFLEMEKFDGVCVRELANEEIRQIAGRAGRYGIYDRGYVTSLFGRKKIRQALKEKAEDIDSIVLPFPKSLLEIDAPLSETMKIWGKAETGEGFEKQDLSVEISLCRFCETVTDDKELIYNMVMIPFDENNEYILGIWKDMFVCRSRGVNYPVYKNMPVPEDSDLLDALELKHKILDLFWAYCERFGVDEDLEYIMETKADVSRRIMDILEKQDFAPRTCRICGKKLSYTFKHNICDRCFKKRYRRTYKVTL